MLGHNAIPEFLDEEANARNLAVHLLPLLEASPERVAQETALAELDDKMTLPDETPSERVARIVLKALPSKP